MARNNSVAVVWTFILRIRLVRWLSMVLGLTDKCSAICPLVSPREMQ